MSKQSNQLRIFWIENDQFCHWTHTKTVNTPFGRTNTWQIRKKDRQEGKENGRRRVTVCGFFGSKGLRVRYSISGQTQQTARKEKKESRLIRPFLAATLKCTHTQMASNRAGKSGKQNGRH